MTDTEVTANTPGALQVKGTNTYRIPTANDVVFDNQIVGTDPDPNIRARLLAEAQSEGIQGA